MEGSLVGRDAFADELVPLGSRIRVKLALAVRIAATRHPELLKKRISPHIFGRHSIAMHLLQSGVDPIVISLWLGHALCSIKSVTTDANSLEFQHGAARVTAEMCW